ncbi:hypothetical protein Y032_0005g2402 [Ancylostoma ceylanicum]|uniref:Uncharacterized protein n=1 Tax=Ancylostoma ceylanicum TaxID=53326 RepID=A0A016VTE9_9BILA|nr:hypothetical protein Y032_0005g2402 [Ancylostoma ceylanicum]
MSIAGLMRGTLIHQTLYLLLCYYAFQNWNCDLEKEARDIIAGGCYDYIDEPPVTNDKARVYMTYGFL